jgi:hypothetical protein
VDVRDNGWLEKGGAGLRVMAAIDSSGWDDRRDEFIGDLSSRHRPHKNCISDEGDFNDFDAV